jgi:hypothetical protein
MVSCCWKVGGFEGDGNIQPGAHPEAGGSAYRERTAWLVLSPKDCCGCSWLASSTQDSHPSPMDNPMVTIVRYAYQNSGSVASVKRCPQISPAHDVEDGSRKSEAPSPSSNTILMCATHETVFEQTGTTHS